MALCLGITRIFLIFKFAIVFLTSHRVVCAFWNSNLDNNARVFTMNDTAAPFDTKHLKLFYNHKPDADANNAIYNSIPSVHNASDPQPAADASARPPQSPGDDVYRRYFKEISQRQLKNIQDMTYPKRGTATRNPDIYKLFKIEAITSKSPYLNQRSHLRSALDLKNNESVPDLFRQSDDSQYGYENKLFSVQMNDKSGNNETDANKRENYFVSYLSDVIPAIEQQIKDGVLTFIEQSNPKTSNGLAQSLKSKYDDAANHEPKAKDDIRYALVKTLKDAYRQYEDVRRIYNIILKIHSDIISVRNQISAKSTSAVSKDTSYSEKHDVLSRLEKDLLLKQQVFTAKQNEFLKIQKDFNEKQREFQATQQLLMRNDQRILDKQRDLSNQQSEIVKRQEFLAIYLKRYIGKLKDTRHLEYEETVPVVPSVWTTPSAPESEDGTSNQAYKVTPLHPVTADKIQQLIRSHLDDSDNPTAFVIKVRNRAADEANEKSDLFKRFVERADESETLQKDVDDLVSKFYHKNFSLDKVMNPNKEYQLGRIVDLVPENIIQLLKMNRRPAGLSEDGLREASAAQRELPKRFKKDRKKRSLDTKPEHNHSYPTLRNRRRNKSKKREKVHLPEKTLVQVDKSVVTVIARGKSGKENAALETAQRYCNEIDQNSNELSFNHCINKFLNWNQATVNPPKILSPHDSTPEGVSRSADGPADHELFNQKDSLAGTYPLVDIKTDKTPVDESTTAMDRLVADSTEKADSEQETAVAVKGGSKMHVMPGDGLPEDTDGNVYWDASVYGNNKYTAVARGGSGEPSMEAADYPFLDADTLDLMSRRKDYVQQYNSKILASAQKQEEKVHRGRKRKEKI